jgi:hypothetical protein
MAKRFYIIHCSYDSDLYPEMDQKLKDTVGRRSDGSGMGCGARDISWYFNHSAQAWEVFKKLRKKRNLTELTLSTQFD